MTWSGLGAAIERHGSLCVGIDPHPSVLADWGLPCTAAGLETCARTMAEALAGHVAVAKPQSAFFEAFGSAGVAVLERVLADLRAGGVLSLLDVKRGDIGSTMAAYAAAYLEEGSPLAADAITVSPYLGFGSLAPALELADRHDRGVIVLCRTSNPEGGQLQQLPAGAGTVSQLIADEAAAANAALGRDLVGLVVGATHEELGLDLSAFTGVVLVPGLGAQGGTPADLRRLFGASPAVLLPSSSRAIMAGGPDVAGVRARIAELAAALAASAATGNI